MHGIVSHGGLEGRMAKRQLLEISEMAEELFRQIRDHDDLPEWCQVKLATIHDRLHSVHSYMSYNHRHPKLHPSLLGGLMPKLASSILPAETWAQDATDRYEARRHKMADIRKFLANRKRMKKESTYEEGTKLAGRSFQYQAMDARDRREAKLHKMEDIKRFLVKKKLMKKESSHEDCGCGCNDCGDGIKLAGVKKEYQNPQGGLNAKGRAYFKRTQGSNLKRPVSMRQAKKSPKSAARRRSFCSRMGGMKRKHNIDCSKNPDKSICKALRKWDC